MAHLDVSKILSDGMDAALMAWAERFSGQSSVLFWVLKDHLAEVEGAGAPRPPEDMAECFAAQQSSANEYWNDVRYSTLAPETKLWGTVINGLRVAAGSDRATEAQKAVFSFPASELLAFFMATRSRMEVADQLFHIFKAMPAPECQALAALLNVHVDAALDEQVMVRLVRLVDHEGPMTDGESEDLSAISNTSLVSAAFRGLRFDA